MASLKDSCSNAHEVRSSQPRNSPNSLRGTDSPRSPNFDGNQWSATTSRANLDLVRGWYRVPNSMTLNLSESSCGVVDSEGLATQVALYSLMFFIGLCLTYCHPVCNVLHFLGLAHSQLVPNDWRILIACYATIVSRAPLRGILRPYCERIAIYQWC